MSTINHSYTLPSALVGDEINLRDLHPCIFNMSVEEDAGLKKSPSFKSTVLKLITGLVTLSLFFA